MTTARVGGSGAVAVRLGAWNRRMTAPLSPSSAGHTLLNTGKQVLLIKGGKPVRPHQVRYYRDEEFGGTAPRR